MVNTYKSLCYPQGYAVTLESGCIIDISKNMCLMLIRSSVPILL